MGWLLLVVIGVGGGLVMGATLALVALEILRSTRPPGESSPARHEAAPGRASPRSRQDRWIGGRSRESVRYPG